MTRIVQIVPFIGPGSGVAGVAWNLERQFRALGATVERYTFEDARQGKSSKWPKARLLRRFARGWRVVWLSTVGTARVRRFLAERPEAISICHNDLLAGDVYVDHGVILASMRARGNPAWLMLRNPFHIFIHLRDRYRYRGRTHRAVVALSRQDVAELHHAYGRVRPPVVVIPNGVDLDRFRPPTPQERREARAALRLGDEERVAVFVGHEFHRKGLDVAIEGLRHAPSVLLLIVGGSDEIIAEANAAAQAVGVGTRVLFVGPRYDLGPFLAAADMFVLPSAYEANALVVLEALASGLPVVTTRVGFAPEVVADGDNGFLVERDARVVGERLEQLALLSDDDLVEWGRRARASVEPYSWRAVAQRYLDLVAELQAERRVRSARDAARGASG
ncbi:UDP-glucose:(heptosyl)LPS alpha-1,3-glucosyltransferase [Agromyces ramosus]|uniref:UDP-glucose:(Heptosyl)LPS alpha-1,3-glucosyltransferase n=1 Tax=Agromyces ramosus TaxID=33879 RepID=A0A4Q7M8I8_9MICO|nr:glycosyltransferase family 4 protein [Agromyces ramosus]RZS63463.1 UDP-glucose:(heptosyl)LPS alpha-1,3-glucosyltransferase [Agromyces ramosus]